MTAHDTQITDVPDASTPQRVRDDRLIESIDPAATASKAGVHANLR